MSLTAGIEFLTKNGLNLIAILDCRAFSPEIAAYFEQDQIDLADYRRLVLLGNGGSDFWRALKQFGHQTDDPVDYFSRILVNRFVDDYLDSHQMLAKGHKMLWLYPQTDYLTPLQQLGEIAGWGHPSPIGNSINAQYGLWFAYRAAFLTTAELPLRQEPSQPSPCESCHDKPCISACPAGAVGAIGRFGLNSCIDQRLVDNSTCADRCLARLACPIAPEHRYPLEQITYHYGRSRDDLAAYRKTP